MTFEEANSRLLHINLKDEKGIFEKQETQFLGEVSRISFKLLLKRFLNGNHFFAKVFIELSTIDIAKGFSGWLYLQPKKEK
jgi:hypothetical protein